MNTKKSQIMFSKQSKFKLYYFIFIFSIILNSQILSQDDLNFSSETLNSGPINDSDSNELVIDAAVSFDDAVNGQNIPQNILQKLELVEVYYYGFDDELRKGQLIVHKDVVQDIREIFDFILETKFPIAKVVPISNYNWSDEASMKDNNTAAFNYRFISGTRVISKHASGLAIDINPVLNPYIKNGVSTPEGSSYDTTKVGTLTANSPLVLEFKKRGWKWGGEWKNLKDYQHFEKILK